MPLRVHFSPSSPPRVRAWQPLLLLGKQTAGLGNAGFSKSLLTAELDAVGLAVSPEGQL